MRVLRGAIGGASWEVASTPIPPALRAHVRSWTGYVERTTGPLIRRELPGPRVVVIFEIGPPIRVYERGGDARFERFRGGFCAGLDDTFSFTEHDGEQSGVQVDLTPRGARALLGVPQSELAGRVVGLGDLLPRAHRAMGERLANAASWDERFDLIEATLLDGLARADDDHAAVTFATRAIHASGGLVDVATLAREVGYGRKHLASLFRDHVGTTPKRYASLVRFDALAARLARGDERSWAALAIDHGFADQAHLAREVRRFAGLTPTDTRSLLRGSIAPLVTSVQDEGAAR